MYTQEQIDWLARNYQQMRITELTRAFNLRFDEFKAKKAIAGTLKRNGIKCGRTGRFGEGSTPWNKGMIGWQAQNSEATQFRPGHIPANCKPMFSERINVDGYMEIKVPKRDRYTGFQTSYVYKHVWLWEKAHGKVPLGHVVVFADGDPMHCVLDNLTTMSRAALLWMNHHGPKTPVGPLRASVIALAKLRTELHQHHEA